MANHGDYITFVFTTDNRSYAFRTYNNRLGQTVGFVEGFEKSGQPLYRRWKFDYDTRKITVHKDKTDLSDAKVKAVDFLRNSPNCQGSPNGTYLANGVQVDVFFKEINEQQDAQTGLDFEVERIDAQNAALKLKGQDFVDVAALIGVFSPDETIMRFALVDFAKNKPKTFLDLVKDPTRQIKSIIRRAIKKNVFNSVHGKMITWEGILIGSDEDEAAVKLAQDENLLKAVKQHLDKVKD